MAGKRDNRQLELDGYFSVPRSPEPRAGSFGFSIELRNMLSRVIKGSPLSRAEIAAKMTDLVYGDAEDGEITKAQIDSWTRSDTAWRFPLEALPAFVEATGAYWLLDAIAERCGCRILIGDQAMLAQLGTLVIHRKRIGEIEAKLKRDVPNEVIEKLIKQAGS